MSNNPYADMSSVIIYSPQTSTDDLIRPLSPTSSLKGVYVRSRPTSMEVPAPGSLGFDFGGFHQLAFNRTVQVETEHASHTHSTSLSTSTLSDESEPSSTPATSAESIHAATADYTYEEYVQKNIARRTAETRARVKALNEGHARARHYAESVAPSVKTTASKSTVLTAFRLGRHFSRNSDQAVNIEEEPGTQEAVQDHATTPNKRTIPFVYRAVTKKVYGVFHRKAYSTPESIEVNPRCSVDSVNDTTTAFIQEPKHSEPLKSSRSLFTRKRRPTIDSQQEPSRVKTMFSQRALSIRRTKASVPLVPNTVSLTSTSLAIENHARLRRSMSFAGFVDLLPELDDELDEATAEATHVATKTSVMVRWANVQRSREGDSDGLGDGYIFERNVE